MGQRKPGVAISRRELNGVMSDPTLSLAAKGILAFVLTRPAGATVTRAELFASNRDPITAIDKAIKELAQSGVISTVPPAKRSAPRRSGGITLHQPPPPEGTSTPQGQVFGTRDAEPPGPSPFWVALIQTKLGL